MMFKLLTITVIIFLDLSATTTTATNLNGECKTSKSNIQELITSFSKQDYCNMSEKLSAFVIGATGEVGKALVKELAKKNSFERVTLIGRRKVEFPQDPEPGSNYSKFDQKIVDFDKMSTDHASDFAGFDVGFCALGTTRRQSGADGFVKVDHDYVMEAAKLAKSGGVKHFNLVSSGGANKDSSFLYFRVKGEVEHEITELGFNRLSIWRPGYLVVKRTESRFVESVLECIAKLDWKRYWSIEVPVLASVMVNNCFQQAKSSVEILYNNDVLRMNSGKDA